MNITSAPITTLILSTLAPDPSNLNVVDKIPLPPLNNALCGDSPTVTPTPEEVKGGTISATDPTGALWFTVATVCVYGLSIVAFIASHLKKRHHVNKDEERQIDLYLKRKHLVSDQNKFHVIRYKMNMLAGSALGQRHNRRISQLRALRPSQTSQHCPLDPVLHEEDEHGAYKDKGTGSSEDIPLVCIVPQPRTQVYPAAFAGLAQQEVQDRLGYGEADLSRDEHDVSDLCKSTARSDGC